MKEMSLKLKIYLAFISLVAVGFLVMFFILDPVLFGKAMMAIPFLLGFIVIFYLIMKNKKEEVQVKIGRILFWGGGIGILLILFIGFQTIATMNGIGFERLLSLWF